jgi:hypothetical protein
MKLLNRIKRRLGIKNKYAVETVRDANGKRRADVIIQPGEKLTLPQRLARFREYQKEQGL